MNTVGVSIEYQQETFEGENFRGLAGREHFTVKALVEC